MVYSFIMKLNIRIIYLYLFSFVGLLVVVFGSIQLVNLTLKVFVFPGADVYEYSAPKIEGQRGPDPVEEQRRMARETHRQRQRELSNAIAMIVVGLPLYLYHWKTIQQESKTHKD